MSRYDDFYYHSDELRSFNPTFGWAIGVRGGGKTHDNLYKRLNQFRKNKKQFIYLRRTEAQVEASKQDLFNDMEKFNYFPGAKLSVSGTGLYFNEENCGKIQALSTAHKVRSIALPNMFEVFYDEFMVEKATDRYLPGEYRKLRAFLETVGRTRDDFRFMGAANATSINNPMFEGFGIRPKRGQRFTKFKDKSGRYSHVIELWADPDYVDYKKKSRLVQAAKDDEYSQYMYENQFLNDNYEFIENMTGKASYWYTIAYEGQGYGVWWQEQKGILHVNKRVEKYCKTKFAFTTEDHKRNVILFRNARQNSMIKELMFAYENGMVRFDSIPTSNAVLTLLDYMRI